MPGNPSTGIDTTVAHTLDLGIRIELLPMDEIFHDISLGLYQQERAGRAAYLAHSYSSIAGAQERVDFVKRAMTTLGGLEEIEGGLVGYSCDNGHPKASRRLFLEAAKLEEGVDALVTHPLTTHDRKSDRNVELISAENGKYRLEIDGEDDAKKEKRRKQLLKALVKIGALEVEGSVLALPCGNSHDALMGLLLRKAVSMRASMADDESRGFLAAPSQQK